MGRITDLSGRTIAGGPTKEEQDEFFRKTVEEGLLRQHQMGIAQGAYAVCTVVNDLAADKAKTADERLADIVQFCSVMRDDPSKLAASDVKNS